MKRRSALKLLASSMSVPAVIHATSAIAHTTRSPQENTHFLQAMDAFAQINPGQSSVSVRVHDADTIHNFDRLGTKQLFVGSAVKTFISAPLRKCETGTIMSFPGIYLKRKVP
jgi:hypothetical protein